MLSLETLASTDSAFILHYRNCSLRLLCLSATVRGAFPTLTIAEASLATLRAVLRYTYSSELEPIFRLDVRQPF